MPTSTSACSIIAANYAAFARVLVDSFFAHHPDASVTVLVIDDEDRTFEPDDVRVDWRRLSDIGLDPAEIHRLAGIYDVTELATAVKPRLLRQLLDEGRTEVIYLDPDIRVYDSLEDIAALARQHGVVLTPHTMVPIPKDGRLIDDLYILAAGVYNLGFIAVGQGSRPFLDWWWQSTRREALVDVGRMMFTDQRWIDFAPSLFDHYLLKDPGCNVAYWNLHGRQLTNDGGRYRVDGLPLRFFHFSGFDASNPGILSRHQGERDRVLVGDHPALAVLCRDYAASLMAAGADRAAARAYGWQFAAAGFEMTRRIRRLYWASLRAAERSGGLEPPDPFDTANPRRFLAWLNAPDESGPPRVSRYLYSIHRDRTDLQLAFPDLHGAGADRFADWVWRDGVVQEQIIVELLPPREGDPDVPIAPAAPVVVAAPVAAAEASAASAGQAPAVSPGEPSVSPVAAPMAPPPVVATLEAMRPHLDALGTPRSSADGRRWQAVRHALQRALFRLIRPYWFQQRQYQDAIFGALLTSAGTLAGEASALRAEVAALRAATDARLKQLADADARADTMLSEISLRLFAMGAPAARSRFIERAANGAERLGYGAAAGADDRGAGARRGTEPVSVTRQRVYIPLLKNRTRIVEIGCGRGGMLDLLRVARLPATGIDLDDSLIAHCRANGHLVERAETLEFLRAATAGSIGAIFTGRLIAQMPFERMQAFLRLCRSRLEPGGVLIAETANPRPLSFEPGVTHAASPRAIAPEVALALCQMAGFEQAHIVFPTGTGDLDVDRFAEATYAVVATSDVDSSRAAPPGPTPSGT